MSFKPDFSHNTKGLNIFYGEITTSAKFEHEQYLASFDIGRHKYDSASIIFTSQFPERNWHALTGEDKIVNAIPDRIVYS